MERFHALDGHFDGVDHLVADRHLARRALDLVRRETHAIETRDLLGDVRVAARAHAGDHFVSDGQYSRFHAHSFVIPSVSEGPVWLGGASASVRAPPATPVPSLRSG